jgi:HlyD family secretion protein
MIKFIIEIFKKVVAFAVKRKILAAVIGLLIVIGGYFGINAIFGASSATKYVLATVEKGSLMTTVSGSGQVSVSQQIDVKPEVSGDVVWVGVTVGQEVYKGQALFSIDSTDAQRNVNDAEISLNESKMQLAEDTAQAPIDYADKIKSLEDAKENLKTEYEDVYVTISDVFTNLPTVMTGARNILYNTNLSGNSSQQNLNVYKGMFSGIDGEILNKLADVAEKDYTTAKAAYDKTFAVIKTVSRYSEEKILKDLLDEGLETVKLISQLIKSESNIIDTIVDFSDKKGTPVSSGVTTFQTNLRTYSSTVNSSVTSVASQVNALENAKDSVVDLEQSLTIFLINNQNGDNPLSLQKSKNNLAKQEEALQDLKDTLADYTVRSTIAGTVAKIDVKAGDSVSSATAEATVISKQYTVELSLNEVDATNIKVGQKATITFDAVEDLTISGEVTEVDAVGTVSGGVVTYDIIVAFDMQDKRVKVGMSSTVSVIIDVKQNVLLIPSSAVKSSGDIYYVEKFIGSDIANITADQLEKTQVEVGSTNDTNMEIISGLSEGDQVLLRTISSSATSATNSSSSKTNQQSGPPAGMMMGF